MSEKDLDSRKGNRLRWRVAKCLTSKCYYICVAVVVALFALNIFVQVFEAE